MTMPEGCNITFQISFIADEKLRPHPESVILYDGLRSNGVRVTGVATSLEKAIVTLKENFK